jgi:membrane-bound lytic murein transglycosylase D
MRQTAKIGLLGLGLALALAGCDESAKNAVRVNQPAPTPPPALRDESLPLLLLQPLSHLTPEIKPRIDVLIENVRASYAAGQRDYQAGKPDLARKDFDHAVNLILESGYPVDSDSRLAKLFDEMVETIHKDELEATREEAEQDSSGEPAPIEEIADMNLPATPLPALAAKAAQEILTVPHDLPLTVNEYVLSYLNFFQTPKGRIIVGHGLERAGRYSEMIRRVLKKEGIPQDLIYLAQAESSFQPRAVSRVGARGIWQFMPYRGQEYDLHRSFWVDERSDPEKATRAAAKHLRDLYEMFGDWYLAMAAYDSGPMNVARAIERTGYADFWELYKRNTLPKETKNYVPIILALALVSKQPALYGIRVEPEKPAPYEVVKPAHPIDLRLVADATDSDSETLKQLNPALLRMTTPNSPDFELRVPAGTAERFLAETALIPPEKWTSWRRHQVSEGETLAALARQYGVTPAAIAQVNDFDPHDEIALGMRLTIPTKPPATAKLVRYRVERGDTLPGIADRFNVTVEELKRWNHIRGARVARGTRLRIFPGGMVAGSSHSATPKSAGSPQGKVQAASIQAAPRGEVQQHRVKRGETLFSIARGYRTTVAALKKANPFLAERPLEAGDLLTIFPVR